MTDVLDHPMRQTIDAELHSRPPLDVAVPAIVHHCALMSEVATPLHGLISPICAALEIDVPSDDARHMIRKTNEGILKWERHGEFETLTFVASDGGGKTENLCWHNKIEPLIAASKHRVRISASRITVGLMDPTEPADEEGPSRMLREAPGTYVGARVSGGDAFLWTDYKIGPDGYTPFRLDAATMSPQRAGRIVQRVLEIETYRFMALLGFPVARQAQVDIQEKNQQLDSIINDLDLNPDLAACQSLLDRIQTLSHQTNVLFGKTAFRFSATKAYSAIVDSRLTELREERISGYSRPSTFLKRRMTPAIDHCIAIERQRDTLERRLSDTSQMLRTKVETGLAGQNKQLLEQIKASTQSQVRLQRAVEGFSVVAISYYMVSILAIFLKGGEKAGLLSGWELYEAAIAPIAIIIVFLLVRRVQQ